MQQFFERVHGPGELMHGSDMSDAEAIEWASERFPSSNFCLVREWVWHEFLFSDDVCTNKAHITIWNKTRDNYYLLQLPKVEETIYNTLSQEQIENKRLEEDQKVSQQTLYLISGLGSLKCMDVLK